MTTPQSPKAVKAYPDTMSDMTLEQQIAYAEREVEGWEDAKSQLTEYGRRDAAAMGAILQTLREHAGTAERLARYEQALIKAAGMISSEYCSHSGQCPSDKPSCYADFIYQALTPPPAAEEGT